MRGRDFMMRLPRGWFVMDIAPRDEFIRRVRQHRPRTCSRKRCWVRAAAAVPFRVFDLDQQQSVWAKFT